MPPLVAEAANAPPLRWADYLAVLHADGFDPSDPSSVAAAAQRLAGLWHDRAFLAAEATRLLEEDRDGPGEGGAQQTMLLASGDGWYVRAALWPAEHDWLYAEYGPARLQYGVVHDHNFPFLTLGYAGPGYASDCWTRDPDIVVGVAGEDGGLVPAGRMTLADGEVRHYRAGIDVHAQRPPERLSVSLNLIATHGGDSWREQYRFDEGRIAAAIQRMGPANMLRIAAAAAPELALPLAEEMALAHPVPRMRRVAAEVLALHRAPCACPDPTAAAADGKAVRQP